MAPGHSTRTYHPTFTVISQDNTICVSYTLRIKGKFPNHKLYTLATSIYIHQFSYVGFVLRHKRLCYHGGLETVDSQHIDSERFSSQHGTLTECWCNVGQRCRHWTNINKTSGQFLIGVGSYNQFSR